MIYSNSLNLRNSLDFNGKTALAAIPPLAPKILLRKWIPIAKTADNAFILSRGDEISCSRLDAKPGPIPTGAGKALCALASESDNIIMCENGPVRLAGNERRSAANDFPAVSFIAETVATFEQPVPARKLKGSALALSKSDRRDIAADIADTYSALASEAAAAGYFVQPCIARADYFDAAGTLIFQGPPVLVSLPGGPQFASSIPVKSTDSPSTDDMTLSLKAYRIVAVFEPVADSRVAAVAISLSPQFHPACNSSDPSLSIARGSDSIIARVSLPGALKNGSEHAKDKVIRAMAHFDELAVTAAHVSAPFCADGKRVRLAQLHDEPAQELAALEKTIRKPMSELSLADAILRPPHSFTASSVATDGNNVLWGGLNVIRYKGYPLHHFAAALGSGAYRYTAVVRFADGSRGVIRSAEGTAEAFTVDALSASIVYPAPDAVDITIIEHHDGLTRKARFPLTPDPSGRFSVYISPDFKPLTLPQAASAQIIDVADAVDSFRNHIAVCDAAYPLDIRRITAVPGHIAAMLPLRVADGAWEYGRSRFIVASRNAVFSLAIAPDSVAVRTLSVSGISSPQGMVAVPDGIVAATDDGLAFISANSRKAEIKAKGCFSELLYDPDNDELIARQGDNNFLFAADSSLGRIGSRTLPTGTRIQTDGRPFIASDAGLYDFRDTVTDALINVRFSTIISPSDRPVAVHRLLADFSARECTLDISLESLHPHTTAPVFAAKLNGPIVAPVPLNVVMRPEKDFSVTIAGITDSSFSLKNISLS